MTDEEFQKRQKGFTPKHLTAEGRRPVNVFEQREKSIKLANIGHRTELDRIIDRAHTMYGVGSNDLNLTIYEIMFYKRFGVWAQAGTDMRSVDHASLAKLHEACIRILYRPAVIEGDERTMTIHDFTGVDANGKPERFSAFVNRLVDNRYRSLKKKAHRDRKTEVGIQANADDPLEDGFINEHQMQRQIAVPEEGVLYNNQIPSQLIGQIHSLNSDFRRTHPAIAHAVLDLDITSSAKIAQMVKEGELQFWVNWGTNKTPRDQERVSEIWKEYKKQFFAVIENYVRATSLASGNSDDPEVLKREMMRIVGMVKRKRNAVGFKKAKRTPEQELGFNTYQVAAGRFSEK